MIRDPKKFEQWERALIASEPVDYARNLELFDAALAHARALGVWPPADPLEGIEVDIELARVLNALRAD